MRIGTPWGTRIGLVAALVIGVTIGRCSTSMRCDHAADRSASASGAPEPMASAGRESPPTSTESPVSDAGLGVDVSVSTSGGVGAPGPVDVGRLKAIETNPRASPSELAELARGHVAIAADEVKQLGASLAATSREPERMALLGRLVARARDGAVAVDVVEALAAAPERDVADALDHLARRDDVPEAARLFAARALRLEATAAKASPQLAVALAVDRVEDCEVARSLVERARNSGDDRAAKRMARFEREDGCGRDRKDDCWACLRGSTLLFEARETARGRAFALPWLDGR